MQDLTAQVSALAPAPAQTATAGVGTSAASGTPAETERFNPGKAESRDWMDVLDNWHRQLHDRLDRMDALQEQLRVGGTRAKTRDPAPAPGRPGEAGAV